MTASKVLLFSFLRQLSGFPSLENCLKKMSDARKGENKKGKSGNNSASSTPQSSPQSGEDERQQLLQSGACGSSDSRKSRSAEKTKARRTSPGKRSPYGSPGATSSRNAPQSGHSSETDLDVSDQEGGTCGQRRPSRSPLKLLKEVLSLKKKTKSPNRSSDPDCSCKDKKNHQPECSKLKNIASDAEGKSTKRSAKKSKPPSSYASQIIAKETEDRTQSSISPDPSVAESFGEATEKHPLLQSGAHGSSCSRESRSTYKAKRDSRRTGLGKRLPYSSLEKSPARAEDYQSSPSKRSRLSPWRNIWTRPPNRSSDAEDSCDDKTDQESDTKGKSPNRSQTRSEAYSRSSSPFSLKKNKRRDATNASPENSRRSKSSSNSDPNVEGKSTKSAKDKGKRSNKSKSNAAASRIPADYDPQEGTSRGLAIDERNRGHSSGDDMEIEDCSEDFIPIIEEQRGSRHRTKSLKSCLRLLKPVTTRERSPRRYNWREFRIQLGQLEWSWLDELRRPRNANAERLPTAHDPDENERGLLRQVEAVRQVSSGGRHQSLSPGLIRRCNCPGAEEGRRVIMHEIGCPYIGELRRRKRRKKCRQDVQPKWDPKDD